MTDAQGNPVPVQYVKPYDRQRDRIARRILARYLKAAGYLARVKGDTLADIAALQAFGKGENVTVGGMKGNAQFSSFDGLIRIRLDAREFVDFDDKFTEARELIFEFMKELTANTDKKDLVTLIEAAFKPSGRTGLLQRSQIVGLQRLNITNPKWARAMALMVESQFVRSGKTYIYCETRPTRNADFENVALDIAAIDAADTDDSEAK